MKMNMLGINISNIKDYEQAYHEVIGRIRNHTTPDYITVNNVHTLVEGIRNKKYGRIINQSFLALPDGKPLSLLGKLKGAKNMGRIFGPTFMEKTIEWGQKDNIKHFFFGSSEKTLSKMVSVIRKRFPRAKIVGSISPPFRALTAKENANYIKEINSAKPDIVWVALGAPKQEIWMYVNYRKLNRGIMIGIGAGFDYLAGNTRHAPQWMKNMALEWFYRLIQEPRRLWKRYLITNTLFIYYVTLELLRLKKFGE